MLPRIPIMRVAVFAVVLAAAPAASAADSDGDGVPPGTPCPFPGAPCSDPEAIEVVGLIRR